jgi:hypothetical protein
MPDSPASNYHPPDNPLPFPSWEIGAKTCKDQVPSPAPWPWRPQRPGVRGLEGTAARAVLSAKGMDEILTAALRRAGLDPAWTMRVSCRIAVICVFLRTSQRVSMSVQIRAGQPP